jgi:hypothetical protein
MKEPINTHPNRESWLTAALNDLRGYFASEGFAIPSGVRIAIGFPSTGRKNKQVGECWDYSTSADGTWEIFIRPDIAEPVAVLSILTAKAVHTVIPPQSGLGKPYKSAALKIGLQGKMRSPEPGSLLMAKLVDLAASLGPLPHASLSITDGPKLRRAVDGKRKQGTRLLKASCEVEGCGYLVRVSATQAREIGPPHCPKHGAMTVEMPEADDDAEAAPRSH